MQFKHPEIFYFLLALLVPILIHLFQFRKFKKFYFTNVRFLKTLSIDSRKSSKIKKWLLLACRTLLFLCLILAFAQLFFTAKDSANKNNELFIVVDNSMSMQVKGQKGALLPRAIQELLEEIPQEMSFSLLTNQSEYWKTNIKTIQSDLQKTPYSATSFKLGQLLSKIKNYETTNKKDILVITDGIGVDATQLKNIPEKELCSFYILKPEEKQNCAVDSVWIKETLDNFYKIEVKLSKQADGEVLLPLSMYNQNQLVAKTEINLKNKTQLASFTIPKNDFNGYVSIIDKGLTFDNTYFFSISKPKKSAVLCIGSAVKNNFLRKIFTDSEFDFSQTEISSLNYSLIEKQNTIVLNEIESIPVALQTTLNVFLENGGNVILIPSETAIIDNLNDFVSKNSSFKFGSISTTENLITTIHFEHPLFLDVFEKRTSNFQYPKVNSSFNLVHNNPNILSFNNKQSFLSGQTNNKGGTLYVFSAAISETNSNFQQSPLIVPCFYKMGINATQTSTIAHTIGANMPFWVTASLPKDAILKIKNKQTEFIPEQQIFNKKVRLQCDELPNIAGNFQIMSKKENIESCSFNYFRGESRNTKYNAKVFSDYTKISNIKSFVDTLQTNRTDSQIWKWFVIFALLFLLCEMAIVRFMK